MPKEDSESLWEGGYMSAKKFRHVNDHLTPLAALIVVPGLLVAPLPRPAAIVGGILIASSVLINYVSIYLMKSNVRFIGAIRVGTNYVVNIFMSWLLYVAWPLVWLLLVLMSIGVAVYQSRRDSLVASCAIAFMLLVVHWSLGGELLFDWAVVWIKAFFIITLNLFVNGLLRISSEPEI
ncbi:hypothetical protein MYX82_13040 [Acidobacteria bacterium AH-259-D05]|nr:hypothetical protein [Acidobacteria bacterium AH-259-D05]